MDIHEIQETPIWGLFEKGRNYHIKTKVSLGKLNTISMIFIMGSTWVVAYANPNILCLLYTSTVRRHHNHAAKLPSCERGGAG